MYDNEAIRRAYTFNLGVSMGSFYVDTCASAMVRVTTSLEHQIGSLNMHTRQERKLAARERRIRPQHHDATLRISVKSD